jgi:predicted RNA-binding protein YlqC (UPF0109 family)
MKTFLEFLLTHIVDHPDDVRVEEEQDERGSVFVIHVHEEDMGKVIGKGGANIQALRQLARIRAAKDGIHALVTVAE